MRRCLDDEKVSVVSVGVRNISAGEVAFLEKNKKRVKIFWAKDKKNWKTAEIVRVLGNSPVYISFDLDCFDPSLLPATGTPEPAGLWWDEVMAIIRAAAKTKKIIGADIVELAPIKNLPSSDFVAAKLGYKILSYALNGKGKKGK